MYPLPAGAAANLSRARQVVVSMVLTALASIDIEKVYDRNVLLLLAETILLAIRRGFRRGFLRQHLSVPLLNSTVAFL